MGDRWPLSACHIGCIGIDFDDILSTLDAFAGADYFANPAHIDPCP